MTARKPKLFPHASGVDINCPSRYNLHRFSVFDSWFYLVNDVRSLDLRLAAAIAAGKAAALASRTLHMGGGTTLPGVVARRIAPDALHRLSAALPQGVTLVGGTNGKTTTTRMLAAILAGDGR